jgi:hypothetical protein
MRSHILRGAVGFLGLLSASWALRNLQYIARGYVNAANIGFAAFEIALCAGCIWFAMNGGRPEVEARLGRALRFGAIVGGISFAAGFFGPMVFAPGSNQGPMLGIFITGPIGFLAGLVFGGVTSPAVAPRRGAL